MKLGLKLLAAPAIIAMVAVCSGALYGVLQMRDANQTRQATGKDLDNFKTIAQAQEQLSSVRADVFRTLTIISSLDDAKTKAVRADLAKQVQGVARVVAAMADNTGGDSEVAKLVAAATPRLETYLKRCDKAIDLSGMDPNVGIGAMRAAEETYGELAKGLLALVARIEALHDERDQEAVARTQRITIALGALMLLSTSIALFLTWRMQRRIMADLHGAVALSEAVAGGDLTRSIASSSPDEIGDLVRALGSMVTRLRESLQTVRQASDQIGTASSEIASANLDLSQRTERAASSLQQTASSMVELTGTVHQTSDSAQTANRLANTASEVAQKGGAAVAQVTTTMDQINASSRKIADIVGTIDGIAFQTNILALNAAVEAARAGEQGRGFAVVATEVRSLAQRSAAAAREIKTLISASVERVEAGSRLVTDAGNTMSEIVASVRRVCDVIAEISAAAAEQSHGIEQVNRSVTQLDQTTQQNAALVEESAATAESLREQAARLGTVVAAFQIEEAKA